MAFQGPKSLHHPDGSTDSSWRSFTCGHCGRETSGFVSGVYPPNRTTFLICTGCCQGTVIATSGEQHPGVAFGPHVAGLPDVVEACYDEARRCLSVQAFTASELLCRKLLMHVAVDKGEEEGLSFAEYLGRLEQRGIITAPMRPWVERIRQHGNSATHRIESPSRDRAQDTLMFTAEFLRLAYEMDHMASKYDPNKPADGERR